MEYIKVKTFNFFQAYNKYLILWNQMIKEDTN